MVADAAQRFGSQCIVVAIDAKKVDNQPFEWELALGKAEPYAELCRLFDRQTEQGRSMGLYSDLLAASVEAVTADFQRKLADGLQSGRHFVIPNLAEQVSPDSEFELVTWLVILEAAQPP
jgi:hypothetical protein